MAVTALIKFVQGLSTPPAGEALIGVLTTPVTVSNGNNSQVVNWTFELIDVPPGSAVPTGVVADGAASNYVFAPDVRGGYHFELTTRDLAGNQASDKRVFQVAELSGRIIPPFNANAVALNFGGQERGWAVAMEGWLHHQDGYALANGATGMLNDVASSVSGEAAPTIRFGGVAPTVTGVVGGYSARSLLAIAGGGPLTLANEDGGSIAANRITTGTGASVVIPLGAAALLVYDATTLRWRLLGGGGGGGGGPPTFIQVRDALALATTPVSFNGQAITNLASPTNPQDAATKAYVDAVSTGLDVKESVIVIAITPIVLSGATVVDGHVCTPGERVLVAGQGGSPAVAHIDNGIYVAAAGAWTRSADLAAAAPAASVFTFVQQGAVNTDTGWVCINNTGTDIVGVDALVFTQFSGVGALVAGNGLVKVGSVLDVVANADGSILANANDIQVGVLATDAQHGVRGGGTQHAVAVPSGAAGFFSGADKAKLDGVAAGAASAVLMWGNDSVSGSTTTRYMTPGYEAEIARTTVIRFRVPRAGTLKNLRVRQNTGAGNGNLIVYTLSVNGVATALAVSMASTANDGSNLVNTVVVAAGDLVDIEITKAALIITSPADVVATMEYAA